MVTLTILAIAAGAFLLWFLPLSKDRTRRLATQVGGSALFALGVGGLLLHLMGAGGA